MTPSMGVGDLDEKVVGSIANATSNVIGAGALGISKILDSKGGPSGIVLYVFHLWPICLPSLLALGQTFTFHPTFWLR